MTKQTQMLGNGDGKAGAVELVEKLKSEVRVLSKISYND